MRAPTARLTLTGSSRENGEGWLGMETKPPTTTLRHHSQCQTGACTNLCPIVIDDRERAVGVEYRLLDSVKRESCDLGRGDIGASDGSLLKVLDWARGRNELSVANDHQDNEAFWLYEQTGSKFPGWRE